MDFNERRGFLLFITSLLAFIVFLMIQNLLNFILGGIILAFFLYPAQKRLRKYVGDGVSALVLLVTSLVLIIIPFIYVIIKVINGLTNLPNMLQNSKVIDIPQVNREIQEITGMDIHIVEASKEAVKHLQDMAVGNIGNIINIGVNVGIGLVLMSFVIFYLLKDGEQLIAYLRKRAPLPDHITNELTEQGKKTCWSVIQGFIIIAVIQGIVGGISLWIVGIPAVVLWTFVMVLTGFIPLVGTVVVWIPATIFLFMTGDRSGALFLAAYNIIIVGAVDQVLRPYAMKRGTDLNALVVLIGVMGGTGLFGFSGIFIGPIILGLLKASVDVLSENWSEM
ncbi:MAG: AI-2E family transporter [Halobacteria archaeon]